MLQTWRQQVCALLVFLSALAAVAWSVRATPQRVAKLMEERQHASSESALALDYYECRDGERGWDYICQRRTEPTALGSSHGHRITIQKVGVMVRGYYKNSGMDRSDLPNEGPILSAKELEAYRKAELARFEAAMKAKNHWSEGPAPARDRARELPFGH